METKSKKIMKKLALVLTLATTIVSATATQVMAQAKDASGTPAAGTPAARTPASGTPASGTPAAGTPAAGTPAAGTPAAGTPASGTPAAGTPASGTPASGKISSTANFTNLSVQDMGSLRFKLAFENPLRQKTKISLIDKDRNVLFDEYMHENTQYVRAFNLSNLSDGEYTFLVESGNDKMKKDFSISTKTLRDVSLASN